MASPVFTVQTRTRSERVSHLPRPGSWCGEEASEGPRRCRRGEGVTSDGRSCFLSPGFCHGDRWA